MRPVHYVRLTFLMIFSSALYSAIAFAGVSTAKYPEKKMYKKTSQAKTISEIVSNGRFLILSDGSVWEIQPRDQIVTKEWLSPAVINIDSSSNGKYPFQLMNEDTQTTVNAKKSSIEEVYLLIEKQKADDGPTDLEKSILQEPPPSKQPKKPMAPKQPAPQKPQQPKQK